MAKRKRKSTKRRRRTNPGALLVNPSRRRRRRRRRAAHTNPSRRRRRRYNPSRRRHARRRYRNPGLMAAVRGSGKALLLAALPATIGGFAMGFIDSKFLGTQGTMVRTAAKVILAGLFGTVGRKYLGPMGSGIAMGAILGSIGTEFGVKAGGGMMAMTKREGVQELISGAAYDQEVQAELGALIDGADDSAGQNYQNALTGTVMDTYSNALGEDAYGDESETYYAS